MSAHTEKSFTRTSLAGYRTSTHIVRYAFFFPCKLAHMFTLKVRDTSKQVNMCTLFARCPEEK